MLGWAVGDCCSLLRGEPEEASAAVRLEAATARRYEAGIAWLMRPPVNRETGVVQGVARVVKSRHRARKEGEAS